MAAFTRISFCSGYDGIGLALAGVIPTLRTVCYVEIEAFAAANLVSKIKAGWLGDAPVWSDLRTFDPTPWIGRVDIIDGGFPCQPFSCAGKRNGVEDERHLWPIIARNIGIIRPGWVFLENVGAISSSKGSGWETVLHHVLNDLEGMGYRATSDFFTAAEVGAPHRRERCFILAHANSEHADGSGPDSGVLRQPASTELSGSQGLADADLSPDGPEQTRRKAGTVDSGSGSGAGLADAAFERLQGVRAVGREGPDPSGQTFLPRGHGFGKRVWPAGLGQAQADWEPPRTLPKSTRELPYGRGPARGRWQEPANGGGIAQPALGRDTHGTADRVGDAELRTAFDSVNEELRLLGNGIVPDQAVLAFVTLFNELSRNL